MVATASADPGEVEGVDVARKEHVDIVAKVFAGEVVNRCGAGARTPMACHAALWEQRQSSGVGSLSIPWFQQKWKNGHSQCTLILPSS